eukprot:243188_1
MMAAVGSSNSLTLIDLSLEDDQLVDSVKRACTSDGFFYISNHGVPQELIDRTYVQAKRFFDLPLEDKLKVELESGTTRGYSTFGRLKIDPDNQTEGCQNERFYARADVSPNGRDEDYLRGTGKWPQNLPNWREFIEEYLSAMKKVGHRLIQLYALALGLDKNYFKRFYTSGDHMMTLIRYSAEISRPTDGIYACGAHTDWGMTTILATDGVQGLQILRQGSNDVPEKWEDVMHIPGTFVVNIGDMLERWSNCVFRSTRHRVVKTTDDPRYSIPFFFDPALDSVVEALETCMAEGEVPKYPPISYAEYIREKMKHHAGY